MKSFRNEVTVQFSAVNNRISTLESMMYWGVGILFSMMLFTLGFIIWDRRTTLAPVKSSIEELRNENEKMKIVFREQSKMNPQLFEVLKSAGIF